MCEVKARTGWEAIRLLVEDDGKPVAAVNLLKRKIPVIGMSIFYAPRGRSGISPTKTSLTSS